MAQGAMYFKFQKTRFIDPENPKVVLKIDACVSQDHSRSATPTEFPVEDGADITDHVHLGPKTLNVEGLVSSTPLEYFDSGISAALSLIPSNAVRGVVGGVASAAQFFTKKSMDKGKENPAKKAFDYLNELMDRRIPFNFVTSLKLYQNMIITSLSISRSSDSGQSLPFSCEMQEIRIVSGGKFVQVLQDNIDGSSSETQSQGKKAVKKVDSSIAYDLFIGN